MWPRWLVPRFSIRTLLLAVAAVAVGLWAYLYLPDILHNRQDRLSRAAIDPYELSIAGNGDPAKAPAELVAILGDSRLKHWAPVWDVAFVNQTTLFSRSRDETARFWDTTSGRQLRVLPGKVSALSGDGAKLFVVGASKADVIEVWDAANWKREAAIDLKQERPCLALVVNKDGSRFGAVFGESQRDCELLVWDVQPPQAIRTLPKVRWTRHTCCFDDAGKRVALHDGSLVHVWDVDEGEELGKAGPFKYKNSTASLYHCLFLPTANHVITGDAGGQVVIWNYETGEEVTRLPKTPGSTQVMTLDARRKALFVGEGSNVFRYELWGQEWRLWEEVTNDAAHRAGVSDAAAGLGTMAFACNDHSVVLNPPIRATDRWLDVKQVAFEPLGRFLATANRSEISIWQVGSWRHLRTWQAETGPVRQLLFTPDGENLASMGNTYCTIWDHQTGVERIRFPVNAVGYRGVISPDGQLLAAATTIRGPTPYAIRLWKIADGTIHKTINHPAASNRGQLAFIGTDTLVMGGGKGMTVWDLANSKLVADLGSKTIQDVPIAVHPDGNRVIMQPWKDMIEVWDLAQQKMLLGTNPHGGKSLARSIAIHPEGKWAASAADNGTACLWEIDTGVVIKQWQLGPPAGFVSQVAFSPDGRYLATVNGNGTAYILRLDWIGGDTNPMRQRGNQSSPAGIPR